jgi:hypothetical protein
MSAQIGSDELDFSVGREWPRRSVLFSLQPHGVGTPHQESLLSLLARISSAHAVNPRVLIRDVFPAAEAAIAGLSCAAFHQQLAGTINGLGRYAELFTVALESLTGQASLRHLTLLPWRDLFPHNGQGLLARHPRWCPVCLEQQYREGRGSVFPLVWSLETYRVCHSHQVPLETCCPSCGKVQPFIPSHPDLTICSHCRRQLGRARSPTTHSHLNSWTAEVVGDMVARQSTPGFAPTRIRFCDFVREQVRAHTGGNRAAFCRVLGFNEFGLNGWLNKGERPSITQFLTLCYGTNTMPTDVFEEGGLGLPLSGLRTPAGKLKSRRTRPRLTAEQRVSIGKVLQDVLLSGEKESVSTIAGRLGIGRACLLYWFPDLCRRLSNQYRLAVKRRSASLRAKQCLLVLDAIDKLRDSGERPSKRKIDVLLRINGISLGQPHLLKAYQEALASL